MATSLAPDVKNQDWTEPRTMSATHRTMPASHATRAGAEWLWMIVGFTLLGAFLSFVVDDYPLRTILAGR
jgi:hypothetical protein